MRRCFRKNHFLLGCAGIALVSISTVPALGHSGASGSAEPNRDTPQPLVRVGDSHRNEVIQGAQNFIDNMASRALHFLKNDDLSQAQKREKFRVLLTESFDTNTLARFALGRYWRTASEKQRETYIELFKQMVIDVYSKRFTDYEGQRFTIENARKANDTDVIVSSKVLPPEGEDGQTIKIDWRVRYKNSAYQIIDVIVEGVSMSLTKRSDFSSVIQRGGGEISVLLDHLREKYGDNSDEKSQAPIPKQKAVR
jgi:phospholipid transport system substrate-binding protein